ncbi:TPA: hypothetical protein JD854_RS13765 [Citrobacter amalonaticus]|uniref:Putative O-antigen transporter n=1 Tax=Citrobacter amalonaticus TaxID=35703 RepID=A0A9C7QLS6_CITAM|nr:hypothetical protein [Citrobacter amalonaticus]
MSYNGRTISLYSLLSKAVNILCGPLTILLISRKLSSEEIAFYYTFFNLIALQQLVELGLGFTLKQCISHAYKLKDNAWTYTSKQEIKGYFKFGMYWFIGISFFIFFVIGPFGIFYYGDYSGSVEWKGAWYAIIAVLTWTILMIPFQIFLEATQNQLIIYRSQVIYALVNSLSLWVFLYFDFKLYSIALSLLCSNLVLLFLLYHKIKSLYHKLKFVKEIDHIKVIFTKLWPLFSRVAVVWGVGFLFWNGFNLISFKLFSTEDAGKIIFSITLARAGFTIAESISTAQTTVVSNKIAHGDKSDARKYYRKYRLASMVLLISGYTFYFIVKSLVPDFYIFNKLMPDSFVLSAFIFFTLLLFLTTSNNFTRCFKIEPFVKVSLWHSLAVPFIYLVTSMYFPFLYLYPCIFILIVSILWSKKIEKNIYLTLGN